jgi:putative transposase
MARQPRLEYEGAMHHVMSRGNDGILTYRDDVDRERFLALLAEEIARSRWTLHDYCLMSNHYHLSITTPECTLSTGMHRLLARYVQYFNRRHGRRGHLFQERFKSVLVEEETHGIVLSRYISLNPVKAGICERPERWKWSSYAARAGFAAAPDWLSVEPLASLIGADVSAQQREYREFVLAGIGLSGDPVDMPIAGMFLGTATWIGRVQQIIDGEERSEEHPRAQVHPGRPDLPGVWTAVAATFDSTSDAIAAGHGTLERRILAYLAFEEGLIPLRQIAAALRLKSAGHISNLVRQCRDELRRDAAVCDLVGACRRRMQRRPPPFLLARYKPSAGARSYHRAASRCRR